MTGSMTSSVPDWERQLRSLLPLFGHRNWIVVADSAYPAQSKPGIETIVSGDEQIPVLRHVLDVWFAKIPSDRNSLCFLGDSQLPFRILNCTYPNCLNC